MKTEKSKERIEETIRFLKTKYGFKEDEEISGPHYTLLRKDINIDGLDFAIEVTFRMSSRFEVILELYDKDNLICYEDVIPGIPLTYCIKISEELENFENKFQRIMASFLEKAKSSEDFQRRYTERKIKEIYEDAYVNYGHGLDIRIQADSYDTLLEIAKDKEFIDVLNKLKEIQKKYEMLNKI